MSIKTLAAVCAALAIWCGGLFAADEPLVTAPNAEGATAAGKTEFDHRIDSWINGTITSFATDGSKFSVRGIVIPYASSYSQMTKEIWTRTQNLDAAQKGESEVAIQNAWADRLERAKTAEPGSEREYHFAVPATAKLAFYDESALCNCSFLYMGSGWSLGPAGSEQAKAPEPSSGGKPADQAAFTWKDLKQGDRVFVGYDSGFFTNDGYVVIRRAAESPRAEVPEIDDLTAEAND